MATSEDQQIRNAILQLLEEYGNTGQIDLQKSPTPATNHSAAG